MNNQINYPIGDNGERLTTCEQVIDYCNEQNFGPKSRVDALIHLCEAHEETIERLKVRLNNENDTK